MPDTDSTSRDSLSAPLLLLLLHLLAGCALMRISFPGWYSSGWAAFHRTTLSAMDDASASAVKLLLKNVTNSPAECG